MRNRDQIGWGYAPKGRTPVLKQTGQGFSNSMVTAESNRGIGSSDLSKSVLTASSRTFTMFVTLLEELSVCFEIE
jgi:hypothetical protein